ncbi:precorrin-3B synthase [Methylopila sp. 73B]|uniref:precorrin-3B synthase n=1 Tax=Methylopila sp. 73B TaxID=1120792 RepID=UPI00035DE45E|nr:precorrin-3B synthase [Methylopila sp. 73B]
MADCPGIAHLAEMADGGLARVRTPGGRLSADQARAVADAAETLGSGVIDLTNRANLQIRGLPLDAGPRLGERLAAAGLYVGGEADRRRNVLLDPLAGLDPTEIVDLRPLAAAVADALGSADVAADLSPKFSVALDGGGRAGLAATASDLTLLVLRGAEGRVALALALAGRPLGVATGQETAVAAILAVAHAAAALGPDTRARDLAPHVVAADLVASGLAAPGADVVWPSEVRPIFGALPGSRSGSRAAVVVPVAVGRLDVGQLRWLAARADEDGEGALVLAPWSAVVLPGVAPARAADLLRRSEAAGFPPVAVVERLTVVACAGAPSCVRAREPAKAAGLALLARAAASGAAPLARVHLSACGKGCAGPADADLLLLGASDAPGWTLHGDAAPRRPGPVLGRLPNADADAILGWLQRRG